jgi:signal transduction histidine kinase
LLRVPVPLQRLAQLRQSLGLADADLHALAAFGPAIARHKQTFADRFHDAFMALGETRLLLEHEERPRFLLHAWSQWLELLFTGRVDREFFTYLWRIGVRHVDVNLDQRYSNLGFALARQFCHEVIAAEAPEEGRDRLVRAADKILDLCVLVETTAYIEAATRCDMEVIRGVADRVRTPATVIGGNLQRLHRKGAFSGDSGELYEALMLENRRLERMVADIETYTEVFTRKPELATCALEPALARALTEVEPQSKLAELTVEVTLAEGAAGVEADPGDLAFLLRCLLQNALDAVDRTEGEAPCIRVTSRLSEELVRGVEIEIFNTGTPPREEDVERFFSPFYSTKAWGSGFGLPTAKVAVRKNFGKLSIAPVPDRGTRVLLSLSRPRKRT